MFKKLFSLILLSYVAISSFLVAEIEYDIQDIGTLQTHSSCAISINNQGQILGWYNIDGSDNGKHYFVRNREGVFYELPFRENGVEINWQYLTDNGKAYGIFNGNANYAVLYVWDQHTGVTNLGNLPGKEIVTINNKGQVLIKSIVENENGRLIRRPVIWENGKIKKLKGLEGDLGIESEESYGFDMNNKGEVVGQSIAYISYKNDLYKQIHAVKWVNGQPIDLYKKVPKSAFSTAITINDRGDMLIKSSIDQYSHNLCWLRNDIIVYQFLNAEGFKINNCGFIYSAHEVIDKNLNGITKYCLNIKLLNDYDSIWMKSEKFISTNAYCETIAQGETIYGEKHAMLITPVKIINYQEENSEQEMLEEEISEEKKEIIDEEKLRFNKLIDFAISEIDYNLQPKIVEKRGYRVDALKSLYYYSGKYFLNDDLREEINESIYFILRCKTISPETTPEKAIKCLIELKAMIQPLKKV